MCLILSSVNQNEEEFYKFQDDLIKINERIKNFEKKRKKVNLLNFHYNFSNFP